MVTHVARADAGEDNLKTVMDSLNSLHKRMDEEKEERKADRARLDSVCNRMDAADEKAKADAARKDAEEKEREEKAKADAAAAEEKAKADAAAAEEKAKADAAAAEEKAKADAARADATTIQGLQQQLEALRKQVPASLSAEDRPKFVAIQMQAEPIYQAFGDAAGAPASLNGETVDEYRLRLATKFKGHSKQWKDIDLSPFKGAALEQVANQIFADAMVEARNPSSFEEGSALQEYITPDQTGRKIRRFRGPPGACWDQFKMPTRAVAAINTKFN